MDRFFGEVKGAAAFLSPEDVHHLVKALRVRIGEEVEIVDGGVLYVAKAVSLNPLVLKTVAEGKPLKEPKPAFHLAFPLLKNGHDELLLQKAAELGCDAFIPFLSARSVVRLAKAEWPHKAERFRRILRAAAMQSKRAEVPVLHDLSTFDDLLALSGYATRLFAFEKEARTGETIALTDVQGSTGTILAISGPEGGFTDDEARKAQSQGFKLISLGPTILRAETAGIALASTLSYLRGRGL